MDKVRIIPADPMEAAQLPIEGVDIPQTETAPGQLDDYPENEGLAEQKARKAAGAVEGADGETLDAEAEAAQRGRTA